MGKPPRRRTRHTGPLSLNPPSVVRLYEYPAKARGGILRDTLARIRGLAVFTECLAEWNG